MAIYESETDTARAIKYIADSDRYIRVWAARIIIKTNSLEALQAYDKYVRYSSFYDPEERKKIKQELELLKKYVPQEKITDVNTLLAKLMTS